MISGGLIPPRRLPSIFGFGICFGCLRCERGKNKAHTAVGAYFKDPAKPYAHRLIFYAREKIDQVFQVQPARKTPAAMCL
jgi:hypothetical protein